MMRVKVGVIGGGLSGVIAAASVSTYSKILRYPLEVYLLSPELGGTPAQLVTPMAGTHSLSGKLVLTPLLSQFLNYLEAQGEAYTWKDPIGFTSKHITINPFTLPYRLRWLTERSGVTVYLTKVLRIDKVGEITKVKTLDGELSFNLVIDASGVNLVARSLELPLIADDPLPASVMVLVRGVNHQRLLRWALDNRDEFYEGTRWELIEDVLAGRGTHWALSGFSGLLKREPLNIPRDRLVMFSFFQPDRVILNVTRVNVSWMEVLSPEAQSEAVRQVEELMRYLRANVPGFQEARLEAVGKLVSRDSPRTYYTVELLTDKHLQVPVPEESYCVTPVGTWRIDLHKGSGVEFGSVPRDGYLIPLSVSFLRGIRGLLLTGKHIGAQGKAYSSVRVQGTLAALSEVIGAAVAFSLKEGIPSADEIWKLQSEVSNLLRRGKEQHEALT